MAKWALSSDRKISERIDALEKELNSIERELMLIQCRVNYIEKERDRRDKFLEEYVKSLSSRPYVKSLKLA